MHLHAPHRYAGASLVLSFVWLAGCGTVFGGNEAPYVVAGTFKANGVDSPTAVNPLIVGTGHRIVLTVEAKDSDRDPLTYAWSASAGDTPTVLGITGAAAGTPDPDADAAVWTAPTTEGPATITCVIRDDRGASSSATAHVLVVNTTVNHVPTAAFVPPTDITLVPSATASLAISVADPDAADADKLTTAFYSSAGSVAPNATDKTKATYTAPAVEGTYNVYAVVQDQRGGAGLAVLKAIVKAN
jgi:hypothetical protein